MKTLPLKIAALLVAHLFLFSLIRTQAQVNPDNPLGGIKTNATWAIENGGASATPANAG